MEELKECLNLLNGQLEPPSDSNSAGLVHFQ